MPLPVMLGLGNVTQVALAVAVQKQSARLAVTATLPAPPAAPKLALTEEKLKTHDCPGGFTVNGNAVLMLPPPTTVTIAVPRLGSRLAGTAAVT